jgi:hypothetical protein
MRLEENPIHKRNLNSNRFRPRSSDYEIENDKYSSVIGSSSYLSIDQKSETNDYNSINENHSDSAKR